MSPLGRQGLYPDYFQISRYCWRGTLGAWCGVHNLAEQLVYRSHQIQCVCTPFVHQEQDKLLLKTTRHHAGALKTLPCNGVCSDEIILVHPGGCQPPTLQRLPSQRSHEAPRYRCFCCLQTRRMRCSPLASQSLPHHQHINSPRDQIFGEICFWCLFFSLVLIYFATVLGE